MVTFRADLKLKCSKIHIEIFDLCDNKFPEDFLGDEYSGSFRRSSNSEDRYKSTT